VPQETQFFRTLFEDAPLPFQALDHQGRIINVNRTWQEELGYERHEVLGRSFSDFIASDERHLFQERFSSFVEQGEVQGVVWTLVRKDGSTLQVSFNGKITRDESGSFQRTQCIFFDLSKRSAAEEELRKSEELRMAFMQSAEEGFALFDPELRLLYMNESGARMMEIPLDEAIGKTLEETSPYAAQSGRLEKYKAVLRTGESVELESYAPNPNRDDYWFTSHAFKVGENLGIIFRDVAEAKLAERELVASEDRWRSLAEGSPDHILLLDSELRMEYANFAAPGLTVDELIGRRLWEFAQDADQARVRGILEAVRDTGLPQDYETSFVSPDGTHITYESRAVPRVGEGGAHGLVVSARDITERKVAERQIGRLLQAQTAMAELAIGFGEARSLLDIYRMAYQKARDLMETTGFFVSRLDEVEQMIHADFVACDGVEQDAASLPPIPLEDEGKGIQSQVFRTGERMIIGDYRAEQPPTETRYHLTQSSEPIKRVEPEDESNLPRSLVAVPMKVRGKVIGVMQVQTEAREAYTAEDADLLAGIASVTAVALENRDLVETSRETYQGVIHALAKAIDLRDPYTSLHQRGAARISSEICKMLELPSAQSRAVELAANIHDIGKIMIPAEILSKPSDLTSAQRMIVESHVLAAHEVLQGIDFPWPIGDIVLQHHERLDGSGYPNGISGDAIRIEARILAVADVADAMTSHRPYRPAHSREVTANELRRLAGTGLDQAAAEACVTLLETRPELFEDAGA